LNLKYPLVSFITLLIIFGLGILSFNLQSFWHQEKYSVIIAVSTPPPLSTPFYIAKAINAFDDTCVRVKYEQVIGGKVAFDQAMSGKVDFGISSNSVIAFQSLTTPSFVTHAMFVQSDNYVKLITYSANKNKLKNADERIKKHLKTNLIMQL
jgi:sulfonate transport system substrate-binding protein